MGRKTKLVQIIEETLSEHKAECIKTIDVKSRTPFADYYILANGLNVRHIDALKEAVVEKLEKNNMPIGHVEGKNGSRWILIDAKQVIVNLFTKEERERISLDELLNQ